jgi:hypothetical protein
VYLIIRLKERRRIKPGGSRNFDERYRSSLLLVGLSSVLLPLAKLRDGAPVVVDLPDLHRIFALSQACESSMKNRRKIFVRSPRVDNNKMKPVSFLLLTWLSGLSMTSADVALGNSKFFDCQELRRGGWPPRDVAESYCPRLWEKGNFVKIFDSGQCRSRSAYHNRRCSFIPRVAKADVAAVVLYGALKNHQSSRSQTQLSGHKLTPRKKLFCDAQTRRFKLSYHSIANKETE